MMYAGQPIGSVPLAANKGPRLVVPSISVKPPPIRTVVINPRKVTS